jgi:hypothetical protein
MVSLKLWSKVNMKKRNIIFNFVLLITAITPFILSGCNAGVKAKDQDGFTIITLPDTQFYSAKFPYLFIEQTIWVRDNVDKLNCKFVIHEGDIVDRSRDLSQWKAAQQAMSVLENKVPYCFSIGNHDMPTDNFNKNFPLTSYSNKKWFGGSFDQTNDNSYHTFDAEGMKFLILCLQYDPNKPKLVDWANNVIEQHPNHRIIVATHSYLDRNRFTPEGQQLWGNVIKKHKNIFFVLCGHLSVGRRTDTGDNGNTVYSLLADYQGNSFGGDGWLRILKFIPTENKIEVRTYSTMRNRFFKQGDDKYSNEQANSFDLPYDMTKNLSYSR